MPGNLWIPLHCLKRVNSWLRNVVWHEIESNSTVPANEDQAEFLFALAWKRLWHRVSRRAGSVQSNPQSGSNHCQITYATSRMSRWLTDRLAVKLAHALEPVPRNQPQDSSQMNFRICSPVKAGRPTSCNAVWFNVKVVPKTADWW